MNAGRPRRTVERERRFLPALLRARFIRFYGPAEYRGPQWPTRDRVIPWAAFVLAMDARAHILAEERVQAMQAALLAHGMANTGANTPERAAVQRQVDREIRDAFPEEG